MSLFKHWQRLNHALASLARTYKSQASLRPVPAVRGMPDPRVDHNTSDISTAGNINSPAAFLKSIGRGAEDKLDVGDWRQFWRMGGSELRAANVDTKDRKFVNISPDVLLLLMIYLLLHGCYRYILWAMEKFRQGYDPKDFAYPPKPKKKIRGYDPFPYVARQILKHSYRIDGAQRCNLANVSGQGESNNRQRVILHAYASWVT